MHLTVAYPLASSTLGNHFYQQFPIMNSPPNQVTEAPSALPQDSPMSSFLLLPLEVRHQIYIHLFGPTPPSNSTPHLILRKASDIIPSICLVSRQIYLESLPFYIQSRVIAPYTIYVLPALTTLLDNLPKHEGFTEIRKLALHHFGLKPLHVAQAMNFITRCTKLEDLRLTLDCRDFTHPPSVASVAQLFHLDTLAALPYLRTLRIDVDTSPASEHLPPDPLSSMAILRDIRRTKMVRGGLVVEKRRAGTMRAYTFYKGNEAIEEQVREWFRDRFRDEGRDVRVLGDDV